MGEEVNQPDSFMGTNKAAMSDLRTRLMEEERDAQAETLSVFKKAQAGKGAIIADQTTTTLVDFPHAAIIQARKEKALVDLFLRRHKKGEKNVDYGDAMDDFSLADQFPGHYYAPVKCCTNCFRVYNFIEEARRKSTHKREKAAKAARKNERLLLKEQQRLELGADNLHPPRGGSDSEDESITSQTQMRAFLTSDGAMMLSRAQQAIESIEKTDVAEIKNYKNPPGAVQMVVATVMIVLRGKSTPFKEARAIMSNGDRFLNEILDFNPEDLADHQYVKLEPYTRNPHYRPDAIKPVSVVAAKFSCWVLGVVNAYKCRKGLAHERVDVLASDEFFNSNFGKHEPTELDSMLSPDSKRADKHSLVAPMPSMQAAMMDVTDAGAASPKRNWQDFEAEKVKRKQRKKNMSTKYNTQSASAVGFGRTGDDLISPVKTSNAPMYDSDESLETTPLAPSSSVHQKRAKVAAQRRRMEQLASEGGATAKGNANERKTLLLSDGVSRVPYEVIGKSEMEITRINFVVIHDIFDSCDMTKMLFINLTKKHPGCQILVFNYPGQAGTTYPNQHSNSTSTMVPAGCEQDEPALNNDWLADTIHQLLGHCDATGEFISSAQPFHLIGIGNGLPIALSFAEKYGEYAKYSKTLRSIVSLNGFSTVDPQLASILHSSLNAFKSFPANRPDLPVAYFTRFLFSDNYLDHVPRNLALNLYTAVTNPISLEGRVRLCAGALKHRSMESVLKNVKVPLVAVQSTENMFINASNVDKLLDGRNASHVWSHQLNLNLPKEQNCYGEQSLEALLGALNRKRGAMVVFVRAGHALAQENQRSVIDLLDVLACPTPSYTGVAVPEVAVSNTAFEPSAKLVKRVAGVPVSQTRAEGSEDGVGEEKKEDKDKYKPGEFLDDPRDQERLEEEAMALASEPVIELTEKVDELPKEKGHFELLQDELMEQIESEHKQMVQDANLAPPTEATFEESTPYLSTGMPDFAFNSAVEEGDEYAMSLEKKEMEIRQNIEERKAKELLLAQQEEERQQQQIMADMQRDIEKDRRKRELEEREQREPPKPFIPPPVGIPPPNKNGTATDLFSPMKPAKSVSSEEPSTRFYMQDVKGGEKELQMYREEALSSATEAGMGIYAGRAQAAPTVSGDVARPNQIRETIPGLNLGEREKGVAQEPFDEMFAQRAGGAGGGGESGASAEAQRLLDMGVPVEALPPGLLVPPPTEDQKAWRSWHANPGKNQSPMPSADEVTAMDDGLSRTYEDDKRTKQRQIAKEEADARKQIEEIQQKQEERRQQFEREDTAKLQKLEYAKLERQALRAQEEMQRRLEIQEQEEKLIKSGLAERYVPGEGQAEPVRAMPPTFYQESQELPAIFRTENDLDKVMDGLEDDSAAARKMGVTKIEEFDKIKAKMAQQQVERDTQLRTLKANEQESLFDEMAGRIQNVARGMLGKKRSRMIKTQFYDQATKVAAVTMIQRTCRGFVSRRAVLRLRQAEVMQLILGSSATTIARVWRGYLGRCIYLSKVRLVSCEFLQRVFRGMLGRKAARMERLRLEEMRKRGQASIKIQSTWKMKVAREEFRVLRVHLLASVEIQRIFRGMIGRRRSARARKWESTEPGADRLKLGLELINESKIAFERQSEEIDALHRAQEKSEARVSHIHQELKESEKELTVLEKELQDIDQIEKDLQELTHERLLLQMGVEGAAGVSRTGGYDPMLGEQEMEKESHDIFDNTGDYEDGEKKKTLGGAGSVKMDKEKLRARQADSHALEMAIHMKRAEREKKKQELESEFTLVFSEVERKKSQLEKLEIAIADMESTRQRKDREFGRLQRNLMELLQEQKFELDSLREKGIELETATATSAAAAAATAAKAKEHEVQSSQMFNQQEELMKFQFMSMSLSYFSSLNMLKQMREINTDTTSAAVSASADTAAAAAAAAAAANIPAIKQLKLGAGDAIDASIAMKEAELRHGKGKEEDAVAAKKEPFPQNVGHWSVGEVSRWLQTLSLGQYVEGFAEACVDGDFLLELREEDMSSVLGVTHKLHRRKIMLAREKLNPLSRMEVMKKEVVLKEEKADKNRASEFGEVPDLVTVMSQCRHGRLKRLEESLRLGFDINSEDEKGNSLLLVAVQNGHRKMLDLILNRGADINKRNGNGQTALHYALAFDTTGELAEFLIEKGADDSLENMFGLSPYDGLGESGM